MIGSPVKYSDFYGEAPPEEPLDFIRHLPKKEIITTISLINAKLKPVYQTHFDDSREKQIECSEFLFLENLNPTKSRFFINLMQRYTSLAINFNLYTRVTCLYALQQIIGDNNFPNIEQRQYTSEDREQIFKFLLCSNQNLLFFDQFHEEGTSEELGEDFFEYFMFKEIPHNQYYETSNPLNVFFKSWSLFSALKNADAFKEHLEVFLNDNFGTSNLDTYFKFQMYNYFKSYDENLGLNYLNVLISETEAIVILDKLSERQEYEVPAKDDLRIFDFFDLKKSPVYINEDVGNDEIRSYIVLDNIFFIEKMYSLFVNDFWFDYLKQNEVCNRTDWGNFIGATFFEPFLEEIFTNSLQNSPYYIYKSTDDLKVSLGRKSEVEYADFYLRKGNKIALIEAKSNYIPMVQGYKLVATVDDYRNLNLPKFYKDFGLSQLSSKTIKFFHEYKMSIGDDGLNENKRVHLYPVLLVNEPILSSTYVAFAMKQRFLKLLEEEGIDLSNEQHSIKPLIILSVSELQAMEESLKSGDCDFFKLFQGYNNILAKQRFTLI
ncbi:hypothetical protein [Flavivirga jejuensis]|uniref:PD-(D/E)XK nuclease superfamily protein n=1 Tax=Flavivirga jejuensis TaxID=870487 RepID=A0ABT8WV73_9FLAO|nr:hypothetical protein [Flavivirga jejuensis]MDO5977083.1 hypothetical protein [Flavivirga jejuensis]